MSNAIKKEIAARDDSEIECVTKYKIIKNFVNKYPNDKDLGRKIRAYMLKVELKRKGL